MISRALDLAVLLLVAVAILMPRPDARAKPALALDAEGRARVAELQAELLAKPGDVEASLALADLFLDGRRPDWALAAAAAAAERAPQDHRLHGRRALALADHYAAAPAYAAAEKALALCEAGSSARCGEAERSRLELLTSTLRRVRHIDMRKDPNAAKENILKALRPTYLPPPPRPKSKAATPPAGGEKPAESAADPGRSPRPEGAPGEEKTPGTKSR
jgi:hypothetical protein